MDLGWAEILDKYRIRLTRLAGFRRDAEWGNRDVRGPRMKRPAARVIKISPAIAFIDVDFPDGKLNRCSI
jgi:hypothetical protein